MNRILLPLLLLTPLAIITQAPSAQAQMWNSTYQRIGNYGHGTVTGPRGYYGTYQRHQIGNYGFSSYQNNYGRTTCNSQRIGSMAFVNCY
jgi:hypothetical protein